MNIIDRPLPRGARKNSPDRIIIHALGEFVIGTDDKVRHAVEHLREYRYKIRGEWKKGLSAHILVCPNGDLLRCRRDDQGAYHAGKDNKNTLGIEFLVLGVHDYVTFRQAISRPYLTDEQYKTGVEFIKTEWVQKLGILKLQRHSDVDPSRKVDPGKGFPWPQFIKDLGLTT